MVTPEDAELLARYTREGDETAFTELVRRRIGLVYAVALRRTRQASLAQDATQAVFASVARRAARLAEHPALAGWFYRAAFNAATDLLRAEAARTRRERESQTMLEDAKAGSAEPDWESLRPLIDATMQQLDERDRAALVLRFFDDRSFAAIGEQLQLTENAARMRTQRALEKLRGLLEQHGVKSTGAALVAVLSQQSAVAVPAGLASAIAASGLAAAPASGGFAFTFFTMTTSKITAASAVILAVGGIGFWAGHRTSAEAPPAFAGTATPAVNPATVATASVSQRNPAQKNTAGLPSASNHLKLDEGDRVPMAELANRGKATPRAAYETFFWAQNAGDVATLEAATYLTPRAAKQAELFFAELSPEKRVEFGTPARLVANYFTGGLKHNPKDDIYQIMAEETGARVYPELLYGLDPAAASDPSYVTLRSEIRMPLTGNLSKTDSILFHSADGWRMLIPPSMIDMFRKNLKSSGVNPNTGKK